MKRPLRIGLTGGIAAGKSTVAEGLRKKGAAVIDTDRLAHEAIRPGGAAYEAVVREFGAEILKPDGTIDRRRLGRRVFSDRAALDRLNGLVHPHVLRAWKEEAERLAREERPPLIVVAIPLLYEVGIEGDFDAVAAVVCREETALERLKDRGLSPEEARARLAMQLPMTEKAQRADFVIWNEDGREILAEQVDRLWNRLMRMADPAAAAATVEE